MSFATVIALAADDDAVYATPAGTQEMWRLGANDQSWTVNELPFELGDSFAQILDMFVADDHVFFGTQGAGIFRTPDGGDTIQEVNAGVPQYNGSAGLQYREIADFTMDQDAIYAGTGAGLEFFNMQFNITGGGALRSTNGGASWQTINNGLPIVGFNLFNEPVFDPINVIFSDDDVLLAGHFLGSGVFRSTNGGASWAEANSGLPLANAISVFAIESFDGNLYAAGFMGPFNVYRSTDGGMTWSPAAAGLPTSSTVAALVATDDTLYAGVAVGNATAGVYESKDGTTWSRVGSMLDGVPILELATRADEVLAGTFVNSAWALQSDCAADFNGDGKSNILDFVAFQNAFVDNDPSADCDADGNFTILDFVCFQGAFPGRLPLTG